MRTKYLTTGILIASLFLNSLDTPKVSADASEAKSERTWEPASASTYSMISVTVGMPSKKMITFNASDQESAPEPVSREIPHLVLNRNGVLTPSYERTLEFSANNVPVYAPGVNVKLTITTQHEDPDLGLRNNSHIQVWQDTTFVPYNEFTHRGVQLHFSATFDRYMKWNNETIKTPTDYFQYQITILDMQGNVRQTYTENYAFLMENQWRTPLPPVLEATPGAAPDELLIYYYDMTPFQADRQDPLTQIPRQDVERYIQVELIPAMTEAFRTQSNDWGFPWYAEWRNFRRDEDPKTLSVALGEYGVWFHGEPPALGHSMISIRVDGTAGEYDNLTDGLMSIFHHELFHNLQRNLSLHFAGHANIAGKDEAWKMFSEGTSSLASAVGQPDVQFDPTSEPRSYLKRANAFIGMDGTFGGGLNKSYETIPYQIAIYWRFLYENCGGMENGHENPAVGMRVIRKTLETLYQGEVVDIDSSTNVIEALPRIMDRALAGSPACPFHSYAESLSQFAEALYSLRLDNGQALDDGHGLHDPNGLYSIPPAEIVPIAARPQGIIKGSLPASYGIDFVELKLDPGTTGQSLGLVFEAPSNSIAEFAVEVMLIRSANADTITARPHWVKTLDLPAAQNGKIVLDGIPIDMGEYDSLGLIVIRTDSQEDLDSKGYYSIQVQIQ